MVTPGREARQHPLYHLFHPLSDHARLLSPQHQRHRHHRLAFAVHGGGADARACPNLYLAQLRHGDRHAVRLVDDDAGDVFRILDQTLAADDVGFAGMLDVAAAGDRIVFLQRLEDLTDRDAITQPVSPDRSRLDIA